MNGLQQTLIERFAEKKFNNKNFTYRDYLELERKLKERNIHDTAEIQKASYKANELQHKPKVRELDSTTVQDIMGISICGGIAAGVATAMLTGDTSASDAYAGVLWGALGGTISSFGNMIAYSDKPITNLINQARIHAQDNKINRLYDRKLLRNYMLYCLRQQEREHTPSYSDFLNAVKENPEDYVL